ncbi:hypothetical protein [Candidatus Neoehrlichia procyonis]|uniref:Uncharacterized protein n=1 Tax=Candidatus Neoehrlichia procyonis str. RAC413 TaxID=1359163 RepID=A0A0F3NQ33_9RICK|nr:hypothetical protein [Candidatus Neoehrlichia lotoris]KJV69024.1 hypothetical protein NLO413_0398 [Candidatus Neoehrlichia lotoris str. RAC413]
MSFKIVVYLSIVIGFFGAFILLFRLYKDHVHQYVINIFYDNDENLTNEEKYKDYLNNKKKEIVRDQISFKNVTEVYHQNNIKVVEVIEPIGKWTKFIMSEKLQRLVGIKFNKKPNGFWQMLIRMQGFTQGKYKGRSR